MQLVVLLLHVPVPFVDLLKLEAGLIGEVLKLLFGGFALGFLVHSLQFVDLITRFAGPLHPDELGAVLLDWRRDAVLNDDWFERRLVLSLRHDPLWLEIQGLYLNTRVNCILWLLRSTVYGGLWSHSGLGLLFRNQLSHPTSSHVALLSGSSHLLGLGFGSTASGHSVGVVRLDGEVLGDLLSDLLLDHLSVPTGSREGTEPFLDL